MTEEDYQRATKLRQSISTTETAIEDFDTFSVGLQDAPYQQLRIMEAEDHSIIYLSRPIGNEELLKVIHKFLINQCEEFKKELEAL